MKAQHRLGLAWSWPRVTAVFLTDVVVLAVASHCPASWQTHHIAWWVGVGLAVVVTILGLVTHRGITLPSALAAWMWDWSADPAAALAVGCTPASDYRHRYGRDLVAVREYEGLLVAVVAVVSDDDALGRHYPGIASTALPVEAVAAELDQFDVHLDGIDIISVESRHDVSAADPDLSPADDDGQPVEQSGLARRRTWLVLRMDPQRNVAAVATRDSLAATLVAATERLVQNLAARRCLVRAVTADELVEVDSAVLAGLQPTWSRPGWRHIKHFNGYATSFWVSPQDITTEALEQLWLADTDATVVTVRLTTCGARPQVSAWVRYHSDTPLSREAVVGLNRLTGRQLAAVQASLPAPALRPALIVPARELNGHEELEVPLGSEPERLALSPEG